MRVEDVATLVRNSFIATGVRFFLHLKKKSSPFYELKIMFLSRYRFYSSGGT